MDRSPKSDDQPLDRLLKLLPAESTAAFLLLRGIFPNDPASKTFQLEAGIFYLLVLVILVSTPFLLSRIWMVKEPFSIIFITVSFVIWAGNIDIERVTAVSEILTRDVWSGFSYILHPLLIRGLLVVWAIVLLPLVIPKKV